MCEVFVGTFTLIDLPRDPLIQMMMAADGVSEKDFSELLLRTRGASCGPATAGENIHDLPPIV